MKHKSSNSKKNKSSKSINKKLTKNNNNYLTNIFNINSSTLKSILSFLVAIGLILILVWVYKYYTNKENFEQQEPIDLLDRIKKNIYENRAIWSNYLYNQQPAKNENPLTYWKVSRDDNTFKYIGNAISTTVKETTGTYIPTKENTMLVQGDTLAPNDAKLLYQFPHNLITNYLFMNADPNVSVFKEINNMEDIEFRLDILKKLYTSLSNAKQRFDTEINENLKTELNNIPFKTYLYNLGNFFKNPSVVLSNTLTNTNKSTDGAFNCIRFPIGFKVIFTFTNDYQIILDPDINYLLDSNGMNFKLLDYTNVHMQKDGNIFKYSNDFGIIEDNGINRDNPNLSDNKTSKIGDKKKENIKYSFNYMVRSSTNGKHDYGYSGEGKSNLFEYLENIYNNNIKRQNYINGYGENYNEYKHSYIAKTDNDIFIASNLDNDATFDKYNEPNDKFVYHKSGAPNANKNGKSELNRIENTYIDNNVIKRFLSSALPLPTTTKPEEFNNIREGFEQIGVNTKLIVNSKIHIEENFINITLNFNDIFDEINDLLKTYLTDESYSWISDIRNYLEENKPNSIEPPTISAGSSESIVVDTDKWINSMLTGNTLTENVTLSNDKNSIEVNYPYFFLDYVFQYPQFSRSWKRKNWGTKEIPIKKAYANRNGSRRNVTESMWNRGQMGGLTQVDFDGFKPTHEIAEIGESLLKNVEIQSNFTAENFPAYTNTTTIINDNSSKLEGLLILISEMSNKLNELKSQIQSNNFKHFPMKIYRPTAPKYYKTVGDIIMSLDSYSTNADFQKFEAEPILGDVACIPEQCVREVREWLPIDKVYEYQEGSKYLAIYKNPYLQSFRAVTRPGVMPPGKVEKIVACVERCKLVDDLIQSDKCAQTFYKAHKNISDTFNLDPDNILHERKSNIYKNKIVERQDRINTLKEVARRLQVQDDKANMINKAYNRHKLQDLVDKQKVNMHKLVDNLEKGKNKIDINVKFNYDKASGTLNALCSSGKLPPAVCDKLNDVLDESARRAITLTGDSRKQFDKQALDTLLRNCPNPDMENLFKRSLVESNCGCYFTDEELENP